MQLTARCRVPAGQCSSNSTHRNTRVVLVRSQASAEGTPDCTRRDLGVLGLAAVVAAPLAFPVQADAAGFKKELKKKKIPLEDYEVHEPSGLRIYELEEGRGKEVKAGDKVSVHFDCLYRGIDAVSSRYARTLGGNRTIAEPLEFVVGEFVTGSVMKPVGDSGGGGLFAGSSGPKPPQAISKAVIGMKPGGRRSVIVDVPALGYPQGNQEIPAGETFELKIDLLSVS